MGQYYKIINVDKQEYILPYDLNNGAKLMEFSYNGNEMVNALTNKLSEDWNGDRVYVVGDYADLSDENEVWYKALKNVLEELDTSNLYSYADENFRNVSKECDIEDHGYRYIYNKGTNQVVVIAHCPIEWAWYDLKEQRGGTCSISPLALLLAIGNGRGGGDYRQNHQGYEYVGSWCDSVRSLCFVKDSPMPGYEEFRPNFTEKEEMISYMCADKEILKAHQIAVERDG